MEGTVQQQQQEQSKMPTIIPVTQDAQHPLALSFLHPEEAAYCRAILLAKEVAQEQREFMEQMKKKIEEEKEIRARFRELYGENADEMLMWTYV
jgi:hypothetical protein